VAGNRRNHCSRELRNRRREGGNGGVGDGRVVNCTPKCELIIASFRVHHTTSTAHSNSSHPNSHTAQARRQSPHSSTHQQYTALHNPRNIHTNTHMQDTGAKIQRREMIGGERPNHPSAATTTHTHLWMLVISVVRARGWAGRKDFSGRRRRRRRSGRPAQRRRRRVPVWRGCEPSAQTPGDRRSERP
jgi:hypothetical protein